MISLHVHNDLDKCPQSSYLRHRNLFDSHSCPAVACTVDGRYVQQSYGSSCSVREGEKKEERRERERECIPDGFLISAFGQDLIPSLSSSPLLVKPSTYHTRFLVLSRDPMPRQQH